MEHQRRKRYSGTHPKHFDEKYKELQPEKYATEIDKIIAKGRTPAGMHLPIMVKEILDILQVKPGQIGIDATLGYGGHTQKILEQLNGKGHLYSLDVDAIEIVKTEQRLRHLGYNEQLWSACNINFKDIDQVLPEDIKADFILADLGVSSMQLDNPQRGFSYKNNGPLDLRLNPTSGIPASELLMELTCKEIEEMLIQYSDEPYASPIAAAIVKNKSRGYIETTSQLRQIIIEALDFLPKKEKEETIKKTCQRVFQAIRIEVNQELSALETFLNQLPSILNSQGRVAILTFHSGEDRLVKKYFKEGFHQGIYQEIAQEVIRLTMEECYQNPRAKSAKLRYAIKK